MPEAHAISTAAAAVAANRHLFRTVIHGSINDVWREITRTDEPMPCFFNMRMNIDGERVGSRLRMRTPDGKYTGVVGDILEWSPPHRFAHTFKFTRFDDPPCVVTYDLREVADGVEFTLTLENVAPGTKTAKQMMQGGPIILATLKATVERQPIPFLMRFIHVVAKLTAPLTPKRCLSERW